MARKKPHHQPTAPFPAASCLRLIIVIGISLALLYQGGWRMIIGIMIIVVMYGIIARWRKQP